MRTQFEGNFMNGNGQNQPKLIGHIKVYADLLFDADSK
jgi:hypothetical protein